MKKQQHELVKNIYFDMLLAVSQNDKETTEQLLEQNGLDSARIVSRTLKNINRYKAVLNLKPDKLEHNELSKLIQERIAHFMQVAPEKVKILLDHFFQERNIVYAFKKAKNPIEQSAIEAMAGQDLLQLLEDLNQLDS